MNKCVICKKETSGLYGGELTPACFDCFLSGALQQYLDGKLLPKEGAPIGNQNARKPANALRKNVTFKLSPDSVKLLKAYAGNKGRLIDKLLTEYFEAQPGGPEPGNERTG